MGISDIKGVIEQTLPTGLITSDVIQDDKNGPLPDYEHWLVEFLNSSAAFMRITDGESFIAQEDQSNGEADAVTSQYEIDFKFILGESMIHALRETSWRYQTLSNGLTIQQSSRRKVMEAVRLHIVLRSRTIADLRALWDVNPKNVSDPEEHDIAGFLKTLGKDKNLFLLYPSLLFTDDGAEVTTSAISDAIYSDYAAALQLRKEHCPGRDTYLAFFLPGRLEVIVIEQNGWSQFDSIPTTASSTFIKNCNWYDPTTYTHLEMLTRA